MDNDVSSEEYKPCMMPDSMITGNLTGSEIGNLASKQDYIEFVETDFGQAMHECVKEQIADSAKIDGVDGYEPDNMEIWEAIYAIQSYQKENGFSELTLSNDEITDTYGQSFLDKIKSKFGGVKDTLTGPIEINDKGLLRDVITYNQRIENVANEIDSPNSPNMGM